MELAERHAVEIDLDDRLGLLDSRVVGERNAEGISFQLPSQDKTVGRVLRRAGYREEERTRSLQLIIVDLASLLRELLRRPTVRFPRGWAPTFLMELTPGCYQFTPYQEIGIR